MGDWRNWSEGWLKEGHYLSFQDEGVTYYERVKQRDLAHYEWPWGWDGTGTATPITIVAGEDSGPFVPEHLEVTRGYSDATKLNHIWQKIFGIKGQVFIYIELPTDKKRHGLPKYSWHTREHRRVAHFTEYMSPYHEPEFITEHFMMRPMAYRIDFAAYNPNTINMTDVWLNFFINKMVTQRIGTESYDEAGLNLTPTRPHFKDILEKLYRQLVPCRPISILPVVAPAVAPAGE